MFSKFQIKDLDFNFFKEGIYSTYERSKHYYKVGVNLFHPYKKEFNDQLAKIKDGSVTIYDGNEIQEKWFSEFKNFDIFISHAHNDGCLVTCFAGWLYENLGLKSFIDSHLWNGCNKLLDAMNGDESTYKKINMVASHVYMMLNTALMQMIDNCECIFFLNTPNSMSIDDGTHSPWIFSEIGMANMLRTNIPIRFQNDIVASEGARPLFECYSKETRVKYKLNLEKFKIINTTCLKKWAESKSNGDEAIDWLYECHGMKKIIGLEEM
jgi:hypothetical protein